MAGCLAREMNAPRSVLYFDHNATHPISATAKRVWLDAVEHFPGNPSSQHRLGQRAERALQEGRERLAAMLGCEAHRVIFTSGATESNNTAIQHMLTDGGNIWVSAIEHPCVREIARDAREIPVDSNGVVSLDWLADALKKEKPQLVAIMAANNETGILQPWQEDLPAA
jgi:cysteine desulfurase